MNMKTRLKRATIGALAALLVFGAGAFAQTEVDEDSASVTVAAISGQRSLQITGVDGTGVIGAGSVGLAFNEDSLSSPFGVVVTDLTYEDVPYQVDATLSNLNRIDPTDGVDGFACGSSTDSISATEFSVDFLSSTSLASPLTRAAEAVLDPTLEFVVTGSELDAVLPGSGSADETVSIVGTTITEALAGAMDVNDGAPSTFGGAAAHPTCEGADLDPDALILQTGTPEEPAGLSALVSTLEASVSDVQTAIDEGLLPAGTADPGGALYTEVESVVVGLLGDLTILESILQGYVDDVLAALSLTSIDLDVVGQTGVYANAPQLNLREGATDVATGLYHGVLTVTLTDLE